VTEGVVGVACDVPKWVCQGDFAVVVVVFEFRCAFL